MAHTKSFHGELGKPDSQSMEKIVSQLVSGRAKFLGYVRKRVSDPELAEDILQDSLLRAVRSAPDIRDEERLVPWFYKVLHNAITDAYRKRSAETNRRLNYAREADDVLTPEDERTICKCMNELIPTLKPEYAEVTRSIELDGEAPEVVAKRLGITRDNLKVRTYRARQALRKRLEETCRVCAVHHCLDCSCK
ncbi:MAG: sigma-70 family RNA polymerase sigma factor [bacterium]